MRKFLHEILGFSSFSNSVLVISLLLRMEKQLKYAVLLRLEEMALMRVTVLLWRGSGISASLSKVDKAYFFDKKWRKDIEDKVLKLELPQSLTKEIIDLVRPISLEELEWKTSLYLLFCKDFSGREIFFPDPVKICWTASGTINYRKTAEELLRCNKLSVIQRYELACHYCLENYISLCWEALPEEKKQDYGSCTYWLPRLPYYWPHILKGDRSKLDDWATKYGDHLPFNRRAFNQRAFEYAAETGYTTAAEYFFQKLIPREKEASLMRTAHAVIADRFDRENRFDLLCYLLSVMTPEQQMEIIKSNPTYVFSCFLRWSQRDLFLKNAGLLWTFLPPSRYAALVGKIVDGCKCSFFNFPKLFNDFFRESPQDFKKWFVDVENEFGSIPASRFLSAFFIHGDSESIEVMFGNLDAADRVKLVFQRRVLLYFLDDEFWWDRWHVLEVFLRAAKLSKEEKGRLKDAFARFLEREELEDGKCKRIFELINQTDGI